jgi:hypothetical protein
MGDCEPYIHRRSGIHSVEYKHTLRAFKVGWGYAMAGCVIGLHRAESPSTLSTCRMQSPMQITGWCLPRATPASSATRPTGCCWTRSSHDSCVTWACNPPAASQPWTPSCRWWQHRWACTPWHLCTHRLLQPPLLQDLSVVVLPVVLVGQVGWRHPCCPLPQRRPHVCFQRTLTPGSRRPCSCSAFD